MINSLYPQFQKWSATGSVYIISDTHFEDSDCKYMDPNWITPQEHMKIIKQNARRGDTLIHLGDVGNPDYLDELKCYKVLISGNHDVLSKVASHFDEVYNGPLFIADRILLSHEPIYGLENFCCNIHGHNHAGPHIIYDETRDAYTHINMASNVCNYIPMNLGKEIKAGMLAHVQNIHRSTIDRASARKECKMNNRFLSIKKDCEECEYNHICKEKEE